MISILMILSLFLHQNESIMCDNVDQDIITLLIEPDGNFPNNSALPVLLYKQAFDFSLKQGPEIIESIFHENNWGNSWRNGIYSFHHYHAKAHEALGVYHGWAKVQLGGPKGEIVRIEKGDLVLLPAGVSHKKIDSGDGFAVVGAYPPGQTPDMNYGKDGERPKTDNLIKNVPVPTTDPLMGKDGGLREIWQ
ncbi:hypothetical protein ACUNWD_15205 [Sunxiuqinia sp. A32]|uniref:hypothetical protein n=1 Tax=Sunxiuqinia sp. A32 TaxID=3461496 RepID=UPI00404682C7